MKKILFVTGNYYPDVSATGNCIDNISNFFHEKGWEVTIISDRIKKDWPDEEWHRGKKIFRIDVPLYRQYSKNKIARTIKKSISNILSLLKIKSWPIKSKSYAKKIATSIINLNNKEHFDFIIYSINPPHNLYVNYLVKNSKDQEAKSVKSYAYYLDMLHGECHSNFFSRKLANKKIFSLEKKCLPFFEEVFLIDTYKTEYGQKEYNFVKKRYFKLPSLDTSLLYSIDNHLSLQDKSKIIFAYIGTIDKNNRNPDKIIDFFKNMSKDNGCQKIEVNFYGKIIDYIFRDFSDSSITIRHHGLASREEVSSIYKKSDFLINIDNINQKTLPSKIFELISTKKPIINFTPYENSITDFYLKKYKNLTSINCGHDFSDGEKQKILRFIKEAPLRKISSNYILKNFNQYTPEPFFTYINNQKP